MTLIWCAIGLLVIVINLNLFLTFKLFNALKHVSLKLPQAESQPVSQQLPVFSARSLGDGGQVHSYDYKEVAKAFVYLSPKCAKCKSKLPELETAVQQSEGLGVVIRLINFENKWRMKLFLKSKILINAALLLDESVYSRLNPTQASPYYQFYDDAGQLQAEGMIGDENWLLFCQQITE